MSLGSVGNQHLQTVPNPQLANATTASLSFWIRVNSGNNVVNPDGVPLFGDTGGTFVATLFGSNSLVLGWPSRDGTTDGGSRCALTLVPGANYHVAAVWQDGSPSYFLNGLPVGTDTQVGSIGGVGDDPAHPYRLESSSAVTDITLVEPTLWVGYALTARDVSKLGDRTTPPQQVAPSSIVPLRPLVGPGVPATVGNTGLAVASTHQAGIQSGSSPVTASIAPSGQALLVHFLDGSGNPANLTAVASSDELQVVTILGPPSGGSFRLGFNGTLTAPIAVAYSVPSVYATFSFPTVVGHAYSVAVRWIYVSYLTPGPNVGFELVGPSQNLISFIQRDARFLPTEVTNGTVTIGPRTFDTVGTFTASATTGYSVRCSGANTVFNGDWKLDAILVTDTTASTTTVYDDQDGSLAYTPPSAIAYKDTTALAYASGDLGRKTFIDAASGGTLTTATPSKIGPVYVATGGAADLHDKLLAAIRVSVPSATSSDLVVTGTGPYVIAFTGNLGNLAQPLITSSDAAIPVYRAVAGGLTPSLAIDGGAAIPLVDPIYAPYVGGQALQPYVFYCLPYSGPASKLVSVGNPSWSTNGYRVTPTTGTVSGNGCFIDSGSNDLDLFRFPNLPTGVTYQVAITWPAGATSTAAVVELRNGNDAVVATATVNQTVTPSDYAYQGHVYKILYSYTLLSSDANALAVRFQGAGTTGTATIDAARIVRTSTDKTITVAPSSVAVLTIPGGLYTTALGAVPATTVTVDNQSGGSILPTFTSATPTTLNKIGYNVGMNADLVEGAPFAVYNNLAHLILCPFEPVRYSSVLASDAAGYPTLISGYNFGTTLAPDYQARAYGVTVTMPHVDYGNTIKGLVGPPPGKWAIIWTGDGVHPTWDVTASGELGARVVEDVRYQNLTGPVRCRVYDVSTYSGYPTTPFVQLSINSTVAHVFDATTHATTGSLADLQIYPPAPSDPTGQTPWGVTTDGTTGTVSTRPPKWSADFFRMIGHGSVLRVMDWLYTNAGCMADFSDWRSPAELSRANFSKATTTSVVSIVPVEGTGIDPWFNTASRSVALVTTDRPHNAFDYCATIRVNTNGGSLGRTNGLGPLTFGYSSGNQYLCNLVKVVNATQFLVMDSGFDVPGGLLPSTHFTGAIGAGGTVTVTRGSLVPLEDIVELGNGAAGQGGDGVARDLWLNMPGPATDDFITRTLDYTGRNHRGTCYLESANETWNYIFPQRTQYGTAHYRIQKYGDPSIGLAADPGSADDTQHNYLGIAKELERTFRLGRAAYLAAGRSSSAIRCVLAVGAGGQDILQQLDACFLYGIVPDAYSTSVYIDNILAGFYSSRYRDMSQGQIEDHWDMVVLGQQQVAAYVAAHRGYLTLKDPTGARGYRDLPIFHYEASIQNPLLANIGSIGYEMAARILRSPRMYHRVLAMLASMQAQGSAGLCIFHLGGDMNAADGGMLTGWPHYTGFNQLAGTGSPSENPDPFDMANVKSQQGGAVERWATLVSSHYHLVPGRNGQIRTIGFPRGMFQPTR